MKKYIIKISLIIFCLLFLASCGGSSDDTSDNGNTGSETETTPVVTVAGLTFAALSTTESSITFTWTDSDDTDFDHVAVTCSDGTDSEDAEIAAGTETFTQSTLNTAALTAETCYTFTFVTEDSEGNTLESGSLLVMTSPAGAGDLTYTLVTSAEELYNIRDDLAGSYYLLTDISLSDYSPDNGVTKGWVPIGDNDEPFTGILFGAGHIVSDLTIDRQSQYQGLFGCSAGKGSGMGMYYLGLEDVDVNGGDKTGALVGMVDLDEGITHTITHCYVTGKVAGDSGCSIGGLVGDLYASSGTSILSDCYSTADVSNGAENSASNSNIGGLVGTNWVWTGTSSITDCYATGSITAYSSGAGGLVGYNTAFNDNGAITMSGCYATGDVSGTSSLGGLVGINCTNMSTGVIEISGCHATGDVTGTADYIGGLGGYYENNGTTTLSDCYATGNVTGGEYLGGLSGYYENGSGHILTVSDCSASGDVTGDAYLGGLSGYHDNEGTINLSDCDATGDVTGGYYAGGLVGFDDCERTGNISRCTASGAVSGVDYIGGLIGEAYTDSGGDITISCVYAAGNVSGNKYVGGLCGRNYIQSTDSSSIITIENAYATGAVSGTSDDIGGLIGDNGYYSTTVYPNFEITNCYATGTVSGTSSSMGGLLGGAVANTTREAVTNCFYDSETTGYVSGSWTEAGTAKSTTEMKTLATFTDTESGTRTDLTEAWDFVDDPNDDANTDDIWTLDNSATDPVNGGYPYLADLPPAE